MKSLHTLLVLGALCALFGCKSSTETTPTTAHRWYDAEGNVYLAPPAPGEGIQIEVDTFPVALGTEVQGDFYFQLPITAPMKVGRIEIAMNKGSHHMNCFRSPLSNAPIDTGITYRKMTFSQNGKDTTLTVPYQQTFYVTTVWNESDMLVEAQIDSLDWNLATMPSDASIDPSLRGMKTVVELAPNQNMIIENHYVNATQQTTPNGKGKIYINLYTATEANTVDASMMIARRTPLNLPPGVETTISKICYFPGLTGYFPLYVLGMTGHYHSRGKQFYVDVVQYKKDSLGQFTSQIDSTPVQSKIYINDTWSQPPFVSYPTPIKLDVGQTIRYTAVYFNNTPNPIGFGPHVETDEHCNLFSWFVPTDPNHTRPAGQSCYDTGQ